ncbi:uncharacterized protein LOC126749502, partial [Anthonomus grandis grandis]|uniref:uncharacterized protein LOC126749502 n=1 Tax=Anthonomus grandis grandis TaxID=2921223 RepID=UPI00216544D5
SVVSSPQGTSTPSKPPPKPPTEDDAVSRLSLPPSRSSGSDSSGYFTPSPPDKHQPTPAFIKMDTEERPNSDIEVQSVGDNNGGDLVDSTAPEQTPVNIEIPNGVDKGSFESSSEKDHCLGESVHDEFSSVESLHLHKNEESMQQMEFAPGGFQVRRKSKSVIDLPNFLPNIYSSRKNINSAPPRPLEDNLSHTTSSVPTLELPLDKPPSDGPSEGVTATKSKLERRFSRKVIRKPVKVTPRSQERPALKPKRDVPTSDDPDGESKLGNPGGGSTRVVQTCQGAPRGHRAPNPSGIHGLGQAY